MGIFSIFFQPLKTFIWIKKNKVSPISIKFEEKNLLIMDCWIPEFDKDSGSRRMYKIIQALVELGYKVFLVTDQRETKINFEYASYYEKLGVTVYRPFVKGSKIINRQKFLETILPNIDIAILSRPDVFKKYYPIIKKNNSKTIIVYDMVDFHYIRFQREFELSKVEEAHREAEKYKRIEKENCKNADLTFVVSETDQTLLSEHDIQCNKTAVISNIHDENSFKNSFNSFEKRKDILFIGGFNHTPNIDAVLHLHNNIRPLILKKDKSIKFHIIGSNVPEEIQNLNDENFIIHGFVKDVTSFFNNARLFVAPLRFGAGIKGKIGQSLEYSLPLITTDIGAEGFDFSPLQDKMIANTAEELSNCILNAYFDEKLWDEIRSNSKNVLSPFSFQNTKETIRKALL